MTLRRLACLCLACVLVGCVPKRGGDLGDSITSNQLEPTKLTGESCIMRFGDKDVRTDLVSKVEPGRYLIEMHAYGETLEREVYRSTDSEFAIIEILGESYSDPLPLLKFPLSLPQSLQWKGTINTAGIGRGATAKIRANKVGESPLANTDAAIEVQVALEIQTGGPRSSIRELTFWFVPNHGLQRRTFGKELERRPDLGELN